MPFEIKNIYNGKIRFTIDLETLRGADLTEFDFNGTDLRNLDFTGANLQDADFAYADLSGAIMKDTDLTSADFSNATMKGVDLTNADMHSVDFFNTIMIDVKFGPEIPIIEKIDAKILEAVQQEGNGLDMSDWHTCGTTHCRGGWAIFLAGKAGKALERKFDTSVAATLIYAASRPDKTIPDFFVSNEEAMADLIACAAE